MMKLAAVDVYIYSVFHYCCPDFLSCLGYTIQMGQAAWAICAAIKEINPEFVASYLNLFIQLYVLFCVMSIICYNSGHSFIL